LLRRTASELHAVGIARARYAPQLSPHFNCFDYIAPNEMGLSRIIRDMLDPKGSHAQGSAFLVAFLKRIGKEEWGDSDPIFLGIEVPTRHIERFNRRLDIEIRWKNRSLVIENKPWAQDQHKQLEDYINELENRSLEEWYLLYLVGTHDAPSIDSINEADRKKWEASGHLSIMCYEALVPDWLSDCIAICKSERFRWFIHEFSKYIMINFKGERDMQERQAVLEKILESEASLEAAHEISSAITDVRTTLIEILYKQLLEALKLENNSRGSNWSLKWDMEYWKRDSGFSILYSREDEQAYQLTFGFEKTQFDDLYVGVNKLHDLEIATTDVDKRKIADLTKSAIPEIDMLYSNQAWPCYGYFPTPMNNWSNNPIPWVRIKRGDLGKYFVELAAKVFDSFEDSKSLHLLQRKTTKGDQSAELMPEQ